MAVTLVGASESIVATKTSYAIYPQSCGFNDDGTKWYEMFSGTTLKLYQFNLSTPYDVSTRSASTGDVAVVNPKQFCFVNDGFAVFYLDYGRFLRGYPLGTAYDLTTAGAAYTGVSLDAQGYAPKGIVVNPDGTRLLILRSVLDEIDQYSLSTPFDLSTLAYDNVKIQLSTFGLIGDCLAMVNDGTTLLISSVDNTRVYQLDLATAWDITTAVNSGVSFNPTHRPMGLAIDPVSHRMLTQADANPSTINSFELVYTAPPEPEVVTSDCSIFLLTLTGAADSTTDAVIPISNVNARLRSGAESYLQVTLPYTAAIVDLIAARTNGDLQLDFVDPTGTTTVCTVALETIQISRGTESSSIVLTGHRQTTNSEPGSHTVIPLSIQTGTTANTVIIPGYDPAILPADEITALGSTFTAATVSLQASASYIQTQLIGVA